MGSEVDELRGRLKESIEWPGQHQEMAVALLGILSAHRVDEKSKLRCIEDLELYPCPTVRLILERMGGAK